MTENCVCCSEARAEYMFSWEEPSEHRKDQIALTVKFMLPMVTLAAGIAVFNYYVWKRR
jgi:hypothetical protein